MAEGDDFFVLDLHVFCKIFFCLYVFRLDARGEFPPRASFLLFIVCPVVPFSFFYFLRGKRKAALCFLGENKKSGIDKQLYIIYNI